MFLDQQKDCINCHMLMGVKENDQRWFNKLGHRKNFATFPKIIFQINLPGHGDCFHIS